MFQERQSVSPFDLTFRMPGSDARHRLAACSEAVACRLLRLFFDAGQASAFQPPREERVARFVSCSLALGTSVKA
jgi:hypothetical protein